MAAQTGLNKTVWIGMAAAMLLAVASPVAASPATPVLIAEAQAALDKGDAQHAVNLAEAGLKESGVSATQRAQLLFCRGLAQELLGAHEAAVGDFTQALATNALPPEERAQALLQRGFLRDGQGQLDQASADYTAVIAMKGDSLATALNNRANIHRRQKRLVEARRDYLAALATGSGKPQYSYYGLGQIAEAQADTLAARISYAKALAADPNYSLAAERLAALGGQPEGTIADAGNVTLRPPPLPPDTGRNFPVLNQVKPKPDEAAMLRRATQDGPIVLHSLKELASALKARTAPSAPPGRKAAPAALRPALDQHDVASARSPARAPVGAPARQPTRPAPSPGPSPAPSSGSDSVEVQLGAWRSQAEADAGWAKAKAKAPNQIGRLNPRIVTADLPGKGRYYRLRTSPAAGQSQAALCDSLMATGLACIPVRD